MTPNINITEIQLFKALKQKLGEQEAEALVTFVQSEVKAQTEVYATQQAAIITKDIAVLREHIDERFLHFDGRFQHLEERFATKEDVAKIETKVAESKFQLVLWAFVFWATQLAAIFAFLKLFLK